MSDEYRPEGFEDTDAPLPRDMPDQQAGAAEEPSPEQESPDRAGDGGAEQPEGAGDDVPDMDEAGAGPRGAPGDEGGPSGTPTPDESTG
ncbi:hypothetical protein ACTMTU_06165 [Streptomyces sp. OZ13]|uniref:hypothetical protein n=1 Tax=Streptomyces sp. OZ13 TaxID=3452210 RepID=UPI003F89AF5E